MPAIESPEAMQQKFETGGLEAMPHIFLGALTASQYIRYFAPHGDVIQISKPIGIYLDARILASTRKGIQTFVL